MCLCLCLCLFVCVCACLFSACVGLSVCACLCVYMFVCLCAYVSAVRILRGHRLCVSRSGRCSEKIFDARLFDSLIVDINISFRDQPL